MIIDRLDRRNNYSEFKNIYKALCLAAKLTPESKETAFHSGDFSVSRITLSSRPVQDYIYEAHQNFIDIHCIVEGVEGIAIADINTLMEATPYDVKNDIRFYRHRIKQDACPIYLTPGMFLVCWPHEAHCTAMMREFPSEIKKLVVKVPFLNNNLL